VKLSIVMKDVTAAEYVASSLASDKVQFLPILLSEFGNDLSTATFYVDNSAAVIILQSGRVDAKTKYRSERWHCL
jgi:hypothetical protein